MNHYKFLNNPFQFACTLLFELDYSRDSSYEKESTEADGFDQSSDLTEDTNALLLEHARMKYEEKRDSVNRLDAKRDSFMKFACGMLAFLAAASRAFNIAIDAPMKVAFVFFLVGVTVLLLSRRSVSVPSMLGIQHLRDGIGKVPNPRDWMAASLHKSCEGLRVIELIISAHINFALVWILLGLISLIPVVFAVTC